MQCAVYVVASSPGPGTTLRHTSDQRVPQASPRTSIRRRVCFPEPLQCHVHVDASFRRPRQCASRFIIDKHENGCTQKYLYLPDTLAGWPWPRMINPYHDQVNAEANIWFGSFKLFTPNSQYAFDKCDTGRLAALLYPEASRGMHIPRNGGYLMPDV